ncbi:hypothetical protein CEXT_412841 [Caerostris extrusa]|uniref:Uncharacterized protein n=1 Tax=Caerostris extrusa TaxID=172846 RepID=A0AAV4XN96_CAEEX|nr:hypothetical protein CEXT_412841 [Caerostris extrusa]
MFTNNEKTVHKLIVLQVCPESSIPAFIFISRLFPRISEKKLLIHFPPPIHLIPQQQNPLSSSERGLHCLPRTTSKTKNHPFPNYIFTASLFCLVHITISILRNPSRATFASLKRVPNHLRKQDNFLSPEIPARHPFKRAGSKHGAKHGIQDKGKAF